MGAIQINLEYSQLFGRGSTLLGMAADEVKSQADTLEELAGVPAAEKFAVYLKNCELRVDYDTGINSVEELQEVFEVLKYISSLPQEHQPKETQLFASQEYLDLLETGINKFGKTLKNQKGKYQNVLRDLPKERREGEIML